MLYQLSYSRKFHDAPPAGPGLSLGSLWWGEQDSNL